MILRRVIHNLRTQNWTAIGIELVIVIIGVFVGTQVANWNQTRLEKQATERMLVQLMPELRTQLEFFDVLKGYYGTTRRYAGQAFAGWKNDPSISDEQFVIAAYQASQITGISINVDSWSLTFGGAQLRDIEEPKIRRNMELALTSDYSAVDLSAVATKYREQVRHIIPIDIQDAIRRECGDRDVKGKDGGSLVVLPTSCALRIEPAEAAAAAAALRARPDLVGELHWHLASVAIFLENAEVLAIPIRNLHRDLSTRSRPSTPPLPRLENQIKDGPWPKTTTISTDAGSA